ncbi:hypothetical protein BDY24DRAFT_371635 [Mrakia frigida]|uniref:RlpA-like double-psi beta-barrel domain-containing protein n=1 Tax=Mrakia frigida TaxID=29902 RepID=UPI003FCBF88B
MRKRREELGCTGRTMQKKAKKPRKLKSKKWKGKKKNPSTASVVEKTTGGMLEEVVDDVMKAIGKSQEVIITWYTGYDLQNSSCWASGDWAPTDQSLTFCNSPSKCVFVRIVDTCAGCAVGSKHVDLTQAAFSSLADLDSRVIWDIKMRMATDPSPDVWDESL